MKRFIYLMCIVFLFPMVSCKKFLDTSPLDFKSPENYFSTESELNTALVGVYNRLEDERMYRRGLFTYLAISDEFFYRNVSTSSLFVLDFDAAQVDIGRFWEACYQGIDRANAILENIQKPVMDEQKRGVIKGETLFLRAYFYFLLVDNYGGVPLKLTSTKNPTDKPLKRATVKEVYDQILQDMSAAYALVQDLKKDPADQSDQGLIYSERVTKSAIAGILAKVCLTMAGEPLKDQSKNAEALKWSDLVIGSGRHMLNPDYKQIFINAAKDVYDTKECIWEIGFYGNNTGSFQQGGTLGITNGIASTDVNDPGYATGTINATARMYNLYDATDVRRDWCIAPFKYVTTNNKTTTVAWTTAQLYDRNIGKWRRQYETVVPKAIDFNSVNFPALRYADVLLMYAEAANEVNGGPTPTAELYLNQVKRRGHNKPVGTPDPAIDVARGLSKGKFLEELQNERAREFAFEGMRQHDLKRWGLYVSKMNSLAVEINANAPSTWKYAASAGKNTTDRNLLFPIPNSELVLNPNIGVNNQNPGW
ncbi:RagB/SusD family nutrient uptake outer membrane protein [Pedobacter nutrimenti]|uniref:Putative outer membrane starch-binding protein n=1 Tax=Pedobacter nutrimenti TaxID=1241337 RepID=A0A318U8E9_9SPHI|nr:RagB/SusD family nutrient uptake outer membrane protein [Pedobacter nutrimenti]PYF69471.1 putative outer membrane starch-binding protein [Pedobacter nutrimenti]